MSQAASAPVKVCVVCKQDVSKKPRVKDPHGRYLCEACYAQSEAKQKAPAAPKPDVKTAPAAPQSAKPAKPAAADDPVFDSIEQLDEDGAGDMLLPEGYDPSLALAAATAKPEPAVRVPPPPSKGGKGKKGGPAAEFLCRHCGYNMAGALTMRCPECGKMNMSPKNDALLDTEREVRRNTYLRPVILTAIGLIGSLIALMVGGVGVEAYVVVFGFWLLSVPVGLLTFWICSLIFLEYDAPFHITALRLSGIYACVGILDAIGYAAGMHVFGWASFGLVILLYMTELEMERWEAVGMAIAGIVVKWVLFIALAVTAGMIFGAVTGGGGVTPPTPAVSTPLVSPSDPSGTVYYDDDGDGKDDVSGNPVPTDAEPVEDPSTTPDSGGGDGSGGD